MENDKEVECSCGASFSSRTSILRHIKFGHSPRWRESLLEIFPLRTRRRSFKAQDNYDYEMNDHGEGQFDVEMAGIDSDVYSGDFDVDDTDVGDFDIDNTAVDYMDDRF